MSDHRYPDWTWEYIASYGNPISQQMIDELNKLGRNGWEIASCVELARTERGVCVYLKRCTGWRKQDGKA